MTLDSTSATTPNAHLLIVDDERALRRTLASQFEHLGYRVTEAASGPKALECLQHQNFDLVLLDLKMPGMDGDEVLVAARPLAPDTAFIILTAYGSLESAITAVRQGAVDYLLKPSPLEEIVRTVEAALAKQQQQRRDKDPLTLLEQALVSLKTTAQQAEETPQVERFIRAGEIIVDTFKQVVVARGRPVNLSPTELEILIYLLRHRDRIISQRELVTHLHGYELDERDARLFLHSHIHRLRQKIEREPASPRLLLTVRGRGYTISTEAAGPHDPSTS